MMRAVADVNFEHQGVTGEVTILASAPDFYSEDVTLVALGKKLGWVHDFFDGSRGGEEGSFIPFDPKTGKALEDARIAADFYAPLGWKAHFRTAEIKKMAKESGEDAYVVVLFTRMSSTTSMGDLVVKLKEVKFDVPVPEDAFRRRMAGK